MARVFVAGEAADSETSGTVEGALASGKRAAKKVMENLRN
jgi:monoamine oxidase